VKKRAGGAGEKKAGGAGEAGGEKIFIKLFPCLPVEAQCIALPLLPYFPYSPIFLFLHLLTWDFSLVLALAALPFWWFVCPLLRGWMTP